MPFDPASGSIDSLSLQLGWDEDANSFTLSPEQHDALLHGCADLLAWAYQRGVFNAVEAMLNIVVRDQPISPEMGELIRSAMTDFAESVVCSPHHDWQPGAETASISFSLQPEDPAIPSPS